MATCKDKNGNIIPCDQIKGDFKPSDDLSKGTEMKEVYTPSKSTKKDPKVYDKLQAEINSGFAKAKYGFEGTDLNKYIKAKRTETIYRSPSKNKKQNETLERINKREGSIFVESTPKLRTIEIQDDPSGRDGKSEIIGKKTEESTKKQTPSSKKRSLDFSNITVSGKIPEMESTELSVSCPKGKPNCKADNKAERQAEKDRIYKLKPDGTQKLKKTFDPKGWLEEQKRSARNRSNKRLAKRSNRRSRRSLF
jgi:hypothetical protein